MPGLMAIEHFVLPTLIKLDQIASVQQEIFGPMLHVVRYACEGLDMLIEEINALWYGLTLGVHSRIDKTISRITQQAHVSNQYVNRNMVGLWSAFSHLWAKGCPGSTGPKAGGPIYLPRLQTLSWLTERGEQRIGRQCHIGGDDGTRRVCILVVWVKQQGRLAVFKASQRYRAWWGAVSGVIRLLPGLLATQYLYADTAR
ncbi:MAG: aldehyde dehydrogenase family protein [Symbiopectobacterium sp.]